MASGSNGASDWFSGNDAAVFLDGAYRLHRSADVGHFTALATEAFPYLASRITCFGADWLGRQFAIDGSRMVDDELQVLLLEPGTGQALEIPVGYGAFHAQELVYEADAAVAHNFFHHWLSQGGQAPGYDQCVGYKVPLYLGGRDNVTNLELMDLEVYWHMAAQLLSKIRHLPVGTRVSSILMSE